MIRHTLILCLTASVMGMAACGDREAPPAPTPEEVSAAVAPAEDLEDETPPAEQPPNAGEVPVSEDFDHEAELTVSATNYKAELAKLDKDIKQDRQ